MSNKNPTVWILNGQMNAGGTESLIMELLRNKYRMFLLTAQNLKLMLTNTNLFGSRDKDMTDSMTV